MSTMRHQPVSSYPGGKLVERRQSSSIQDSPRKGMKLESGLEKG